MQTINNLNQPRLFKASSYLSSPSHEHQRDDIINGWPDVFLNEVYPNLPVDKVKELYCADNGRPTKDLSTMTGMVVIQELFNYTNKETLAALMHDRRLHYALNLPSDTDNQVYIAPKTYFNFCHRIMENDLAGDIFDMVTLGFAEKFSVDFTSQRLDSVHIQTNMKNGRRLDLLSTMNTKFLRTLSRVEIDEFARLPQALRDRYLLEDKAGNGYFGNVKPFHRSLAMATVANDMYQLINKFESVETVAQLDDFKLMVKVFSQQCIVVAPSAESPNEDVAITLKDDPDSHDDSNILGEDFDDGGLSEDLSQIQSDERPENLFATMKDPKDVAIGSVQYPSDPDATYDPHKGRGYQAQIAETYSDNENHGLKLVTYVKLEKASDHDANALKPAVDNLESKGLKPTSMSVDTAYGGDDNWVYALEKGIELISPIGGKNPDKNTDCHEETATFVGKPISLPELAQLESMAKCYQIDLELYPVEELVAVSDEPFTLVDFHSTDHGVIISCPIGHSPESIVPNKTGDGASLYFSLDSCHVCPFHARCPVKLRVNQAKLTYRYKDVRLAKRRSYQNQSEFKEKYRWRSGIEATNSQLARLGLKRLRVRGLKAATLKVQMKALALNIWRLVGYLPPKFGVGR
jgi:hypothetical protein